jgi:molybdenum cofactor guanylyltransferase
MTEPDSYRRETSSSVCGVILAGGKSRRMGGRNKALVEVGGRRVIERVSDALHRVMRDVIVITNHPEDYEFLALPMYRDIIPGYSALGGLYTGLKVCGGSHGLFVACDMPFLNERVLAHMVALVDGGHDIVIPRIRGLLEPLHAIYATSCLPYVEKLMKAGDLKIVNMYPFVSILEVPEDDLRVFDPTFRFIMNVNTPDDLRKARQPESAER